MGNSNSTVEEPPAQEEAPVEDKFEVSIATNLVYRLAADADKEAARSIPVIPLQKELERKEQVVEPQLDHPIVDKPSTPPPPQPQSLPQPEEIVHHIAPPINTEKLSELLETQRQERRAETETKRTQLLKLEDEKLKEIHTKVETLRHTYARTTHAGCTKESNAVLECYVAGGNNCKKVIEDLRLCAKARIET